MTWDFGESCTLFLAKWGYFHITICLSPEWVLGKFLFSRGDPHSFGGVVLEFLLAQQSSASGEPGLLGHNELQEQPHLPESLASLLGRKKRTNAPGITMDFTPITTTLQWSSYCHPYWPVRKLEFRETRGFAASLGRKPRLEDILSFNIPSVFDFFW